MFGKDVGMIIKGLAKLTLLDFPGKVACTVFTGGCNFRCPFCHNASLAVRPGEVNAIDEAEVLSLLQKRKGVLEGVCVTGGEPMLCADLPDFLAKVKALGYAVKLDTNGSFPDKLRALVREGLVDRVAVDIKNSPAKYALTAGVPDMDLRPICETVDFLKEGHVDYEFRTTVVKELHEASDFEAIGRWIAGAQSYALQPFKDSGDVIEQGLSAPSSEDLAAFLAIVSKYVSNAQIRGV